MKTSKLSLKKVQNINRQIKLYGNDIAEIVDRDDEAKIIKLKSTTVFYIVRDFYEFYIDNQSLMNLISKTYWNVEVNEDGEIFNSLVGCIGSFGSLWDGISIKILTQKPFDKNQRNDLFDMFKQNYNEPQNSINEKRIKEEIADEVVNDFLFYCCQGCGDSGCSGITFSIIKKENKIFWTDNEKINI